MRCKVARPPRRDEVIWHTDQARARERCTSEGGVDGEIVYFTSTRVHSWDERQREGEGGWDSSQEARTSARSRAGGVLAKSKTQRQS